MSEDDVVTRYADVLVDVGLNLQPGRTVAIDGQLEHAPLMRAVADAAYRRGAAFVDLWYWDPVAKRSRLAHAPADTLERRPDWIDDRYRALAAEPGGGCLVRITGDPNPDLFGDLVPERVARDTLPYSAVRNQLQTQMLVEWTIGCCPTASWAEQVLGTPDVDELWRLVGHVMRLDEPDPVAAWRQRMDELSRRRVALDALGLDRLHLRGPGTDLTLGLPEDHCWLTAELVSRRGVRQVINLPTEEVASSPDPSRAEGVVSATKPLALAGTVVRDLQLRLVDGEIAEVSASTGADVVRRHIATDPGASRLGEIALVDGSSRVAATGRLFFETLLDENAACHIAWGGGIAEARRGYDPTDPGSFERLQVNDSAVHTDFMVGGPQVTVTGVGRDEREWLILDGERWCLGA